MSFAKSNTAGGFPRPIEQIAGPPITMRERGRVGSAPAINDPALLSNSMAGAGARPPASAVVPRGASSLRVLSGGAPPVAKDATVSELLANERARSDMHRLNYEALRQRFTQIQEEHSRLENEHAALLEAKQIIQDCFDQAAEQYKREVQELQARLSEMRSQLLTPQRVEMLRMEITDELQRQFQERAAILDQEVQAARGELNKLRYENTFLKSEFEHLQQEHTQTVETMKLQHETEVTNLRKEREAILTKQESEAGEDIRKLRQAQRDLAAAQTRVKALTSELEEVRARVEADRLQNDSAQRALQRQSSEQSSSVKQLMLEREALRTQVERVQAELKEAHEGQTAYLRKVHDAEQEAARQRARVLELEHSVKFSQGHQQLDLLKHKQEQEEARERTQQENEVLRGECDQLRQRLKQLEQQALDAEKEATRREQAARQLETQRVIELESNKLELESRLASLERRRSEEEEQHAAVRARIENELHAVQEARSAADAQLLQLQSRLAQQAQLEERARDEVKQGADARRKLADTEIELTALLHEQNQLLEANTALSDQAKRLEAELHATEERSRREMTELQRQLAESSAQWSAEREQLVQKVNSTETRLVEVQHKDNQEKSTLLKKKNKYIMVIKALKNKAELADKRAEQLATENDVLKRNVPLETHLRVQKQLHDLYRRHVEFRNVILRPQVPDLATFLALNAATRPPPSLAPVDAPSLEQLMQLGSDHDRDLQTVKQRLEHLDRLQHEQLASLTAMNQQQQQAPQLAERERVLSPSTEALGHQSAASRLAPLSPSAFPAADSGPLGGRLPPLSASSK